MVTLVATMGIPGSGKSTWARAHANEIGATLVTLDDIRSGASPVQTINAALQITGQALESGASVVLDGCNTNPTMRRRWLRLAWRHRARPVLHVMRTPHAVSLARNEARPVADRVPADRMASYVDGWDIAVRRALGEGWSVDGAASRSVTAGATHSW